MKSWPCDNLYLSAFLCALGYQLIGKKNNGLKTSILFEKSESLDKDALSFYNGATVEAKKFVDAYRMIKDFVFES